MIDHLKPIVIGLVWKDDELKDQVVETFVPKARQTDYFYTPNASTDDAIRTAELVNPDKLQYLQNKHPEQVDAYVESIRSALEYPFFFESVAIRTPIKEIFNAKVGSQGENLSNRVEFQILDQLLSLYGRLPGFSVKELCDKVEVIAKIKTPYDDMMTPKWGRELEKEIAWLDKDALFRNFKQRLRETINTYEREVEAQFEANEDGTLEDKLNKQQVVLVPDVATKKEAKFILSQDNGILVFVNEVDNKLMKLAKYIHPVENVAEARYAIHDSIKNLGA